MYWQSGVPCTMQSNLPTNLAAIQSSVITLHLGVLALRLGLFTPPVGLKRVSSLPAPVQ